MLFFGFSYLYPVAVCFREGCKHISSFETLTEVPVRIQALDSYIPCTLGGCFQPMYVNLAACVRDFG